MDTLPGYSHIVVHCSRSDNLQTDMLRKFNRQSDLGMKEHGNFSALALFLFSRKFFVMICSVLCSRALRVLKALFTCSVGVSN